MRQCFEAVTVNPARLLGLPGYGLEAGCYADFVLLAESPASTSLLHLPGRAGQTSMMMRP